MCVSVHFVNAIKYPPRKLLSHFLISDKLLLQNVMATYTIDHPIVHADKLAVFTCNNEINEINVRWYFIKNWKTLTLGMDNSTILFIAGIHGKKTGKFGPNENIQTLKNQVTSFEAI